MKTEEFNWLDALVGGIAVAGTVAVLVLAIFGSAYNAGWLP